MESSAVKLHLERLLSSRPHPKTICPSEVARSLTTSELEGCGVTTWRDLMPDIRGLLWKMRDKGEVEILQGGQPIPSTLLVEDIKGPIRARKRSGTNVNVS